MNKQRFEKWTDIFVRLGYNPINDGRYSGSKVKQLELLAYLFDVVDSSQLCRCGLYPSKDAVYSTLWRSIKKESVLSPILVKGSSCEAYGIEGAAAQRTSDELFLSVLNETDQAVVSRNRFRADRVHELFASNAAISMVYSNLPKFSVSLDHTLFRGVSTIRDLLEKQEDIGRPFNQLAPDITARFESGVSFVEVDRNTESTLSFNQKIRGYFETLQSLKPEELSEVSAFVACFNRDDCTDRTKPGQRSIMSKSGIRTLSESCMAACDRRINGLKFANWLKAFRACANKGLRFFFLPGIRCWYPEEYDLLLRKENGTFTDADDAVAGMLGRNDFKKVTYGRHEVVLPEGSISFPTTILPTNASQEDSVPIAVENLSLDLCAKERVLHLLTANEYFGDPISDPSLWMFFILDVNSEQDAINFMTSLEDNVREKYQDNFMVAKRLERGSIYNFYGIRVGNDGTFEYSGPYHSFIFRCGEQLFLPKQNTNRNFVRGCLAWRQTSPYTCYVI